jgi:hypothetical protein
MFFRREKPRELSFAERIASLERQGFAAEPQGRGRIKVSRDSCAAIVQQERDGSARITRAGVLAGGEIAVVVDGGYQKFLESPGGRRVPALAAHLQKLHAFLEDLRDGLGLVSLYNESLSTVNDLHRYDRVRDRDRGVPRRAWER